MGLTLCLASRSLVQLTMWVTATRNATTTKFLSCLLNVMLCVIGYGHRGMLITCINAGPDRGRSKTLFRATCGKATLRSPSRHILRMDQPPGHYISPSPAQARDCAVTKFLQDQCSVCCPYPSRCPLTHIKKHKCDAARVMLIPVREVNVMLHTSYRH